MKIEEAIVYVLASSGYGMKAEQIARKSMTGGYSPVGIKSQWMGRWFTQW